MYPLLCTKLIDPDLLDQSNQELAGAGSFELNMSEEAVKLRKDIEAFESHEIHTMLYFFSTGKKKKAMKILRKFLPNLTKDQYISEKQDKEAYDLFMKTENNE